MSYTLKNKKIESFIYEGLGFPIKLINVLLKKALGLWVIDIDMDELQTLAIQALIKKPAPLTGRELRYIRKFQEISGTDCQKELGITHADLLAMEKEHGKISPPLELVYDSNQKCLKSSWID
jgi:hypothetical protein